MPLFKYDQMSNSIKSMLKEGILPDMVQNKHWHAHDKSYLVIASKTWMKGMDIMLKL